MTERKNDLNGKLEKLKTYIKEQGSLAVAFSGGVDSTFLLKTAHDVLGDGCFAITARSASFPRREQEEAAAFCRDENIPERWTYRPTRGTGKTAAITASTRCFPK